MIQVRDLLKDYGEIRAVDHISFEIHEGEIVGFLGPNGAGKSTTLKMLTGFLEPTAGDIIVRDLSMASNSLEIRSLMGYLPEHNSLYEEMCVYDYLHYIAQIRELTEKKFLKRLDFVIEKCGLREVISQTIQTLSKGYRQRVGIAQAILHDPTFLILDEPTSGLDPNQILEIRDLIRDLGKEKTVIISSHILQEIQAVADRILIINKGQIIADGKQQDLQTSLIGKTLLILEFEAVNPDIDSLVSSTGCSLHESTSNGDSHQLVLEYLESTDPRKGIYLFAKEHDWVILEMHRKELSLEDLFHGLTLKQEMMEEALEEGGQDE
ncbi:MAG TPA: ATP-binding cassette domain-containing protein [Candidatus Cloacimonadota bacterium]|nr:ATP-binding cassette domain-containing protein [Candidatus Cloacimonadota bacterium]HPT72649.1 ATP-binding cassette domain-containing protein [Candidatus Cloacimonadota bacterium]